MIGYCRKLILAAFMIGVALATARAQDTDLVHIQAHYVRASTQLISWPEGAVVDTFRFGIVKNQAVFRALKKEMAKVENETVHGFPFAIYLLKDLSRIQNMNLVYSDYADGISATDLMQATGREPVFLITYGYSFNATMINMIMHEKEMKYDLNEYNLRKNGLEPKPALSKFSVEPDEEDWNNMVVQLQDQLTRQTDVSYKLEQANENLQKNVNVLNTAVKNLETEIADRQKELNVISNKIRAQNLQFQQLKKEEGKTRELLNESRAELEAKESAMADIESDLTEKNAALVLSKKDLVAVESKMSRALKLLENQRILSIGIGLVALIIAALGILAFRNYRKQKSQATIIAKQLELTERQREEISAKSALLEEKNHEILDSINYARRIQDAILPPIKLVQQHLTNSFILYKPKDIVAGDFYWLETIDDEVFFAAADCTGHGVPGAMVSVVCSNALNKAVIEMGLREPAVILDAVRDLVVQTFEKSEEEVKDGMDISFCRLNLKTLKLMHAGAHNPLYRITANDGTVDEKTVNDETRMLIEYKVDKQPIGKWSFSRPFTQQEIQLTEGDVLYIFTDGYADQFGGEKGKKFMYKPFKNLLLSLHSEPMEQQKQLLDNAFESWKAGFQQIDDVCVFGIKV